MVPHKTPLILQKLMPSRLWRIPAVGKTLYLTFDDGPIPGLTDWVLDELKLKGAKATFFCVGENITKHPDLFKRIVEEGHQIGNHTQNHLNGWETESSVYLNNVQVCQEAIISQGCQTHFFRPPYGRLRWQQKRQLSNYKVVMWDVLSKDYLQTIAPETVLKESIKATEPGSIIVFHDNVKAEKNLKYVLPRYIDHMQSLGFQFDKLT